MQIRILILFFILITSIFAKVDFQNDKIYKTDITSQKAYEMQQKGILLIDVRTKREFSTLRAKDSKNIPVFYEENGKRIINKNFVNKVYKILQENINKDIILICRSARTKLASNILAFKGFTNVYNIKNGFQNDWKKIDLPTQK
jgi:rhodanese-related sulfurtransferase